VTDELGSGMRAMRAMERKTKDEQKKTKEETTEKRRAGCKERRRRAMGACVCVRVCEGVCLAGTEDKMRNE